MEKEFELKAFRVRYYCDEEGCDGEVRFDKEAFDNSPNMSMHPTWRHLCQNCGKEYEFPDKALYPHKTYKEV